MEQEKTLAAMALVEIFQAFARGLEQPAVVFTRKRGRIGVVREQAEEQICFLVGQVADLQLLHLGPDRLRVHQHHRHDHQGAEGIGNPRILEIHLGQGPGRQKSRDQVIDHLDRQLADRNQQEQQQSKADSGRRVRPGRCQDRAEPIREMNSAEKPPMPKA